MESSEQFTLENDVLRAQFDAETGVLVSLISKATGWAAQRRPELGLSFEMLVPLPERRNNPVHGAKQRCTRVTPSDDGTSVIFVWQGLQSELGGELDITFTGVVTLDDTGLTFAGAVVNRSPFVVESVAYPCLGDIAQPAGDEPLFRWTNEFTGYGKRPLLPEFVGSNGYYGFDSPISLSIFPPFMFFLLASDKQGFYVGCHDLSQRELVDYSFTLKPGYRDTHTMSRGSVPTGDEIGGLPVHLEMRTLHMPYTQPGETFALSPVVLQPYVGTWHVGVDHYKAWYSTWYTPPACPEWARNVHAWQQLQMNSPEDELRFRFSELPQYAEECARHGVQAIQLVGWNKGGQDRGNPCHDPDPRLGTREEFIDAIAACQRMGVKIILFTKFTWAERGSAWYREELEKLAMRDPYGDAYHHQGYQYQTTSQLLDISTRRFSPMCMLSAQWREIAGRELIKCVESGAAGMLFDECCHHGSARYCFDPSHGHRVPDFGYRGDAELERGFHDITDRLNPDFLYAGEACYDLQLRHYNIAYTRLCDNPVLWQRYIDPWQGILVAITGFDDRINLNLCLLHRYIISYEPFNFKGHLEDYPLTLDYGKKIDALRTRYRAYLWDANYSHTLGASATVEGHAYQEYTVYTQLDTGKRAIAIANAKSEQAISVTVAFDGAARGTLMLVTPEAPEMQPTGDTINIPARSVAVILES